MEKTQKYKSTNWGVRLALIVTLGVIYLIIIIAEEQPEGHIIHFDPTYADQIKIREVEIRDSLSGNRADDMSRIRQINMAISENQSIIDELETMNHEDPKSEGYKKQVLEYADSTNSYLETLAVGIKDGTGEDQDNEYRQDLYGEITENISAYKFEPK